MRPTSIPYRVVYIKRWERQDAVTIANEIKYQIDSRFNIQMYALDWTGGYGEDLLNRLTEWELQAMGVKIKMKSKNDLTFNLDDALMNEQLWVNDHPNDIEAEELRFQLGGYIGKVNPNGYYSFDSTVGRDHDVDGLKLAWHAVEIGSFEPIIEIRKRR